MSWANLDDGFADHPKILGLSDAAFRLHTCALCWCSRRGTDGAVVPRDLKTLGSMIQSQVDPARLVADELVPAKLWDPTDAGWQIHNWKKRNKPAAKIEEEREASRARIAAWREARKAEKAAERLAAAGSQDGNATAYSVHTPSHPIPSDPTLSYPMEDLRSSNLFPPRGASDMPAAGVQEQPPVAPKGPAQVPGKGKHTATAIALLGELSAARKRCKPGCEDLQPLPCNLRELTGRLADGHTPEEIRGVIGYLEASVKAGSYDMNYFTPVNPFRQRNFGGHSGKTAADVRQPPLHGKQSWPTARAPPRQDQLTTSKTATTREIKGVEGLRAIGINVPPGAVDHGPATESDRGNDKPF